MIKRLLFFLILGFCLFSCKENDFEAIRDKVQHKFANEPQKKRDALLLLENSKEEEHYTGKGYELYLSLVEKFSKNPEALEIQLLKLKGIMPNFNLESDFSVYSEDDFINDFLVHDKNIKD